MPLLNRTERQRKAAKRAIMGNLDENAENVVSVVHPGGVSKSAEQLDMTNPEHIRLLIEDIEKHLKTKLTMLAEEKEKGKREQEEVYRCGLPKLTKDVRQMTVKEFNTNYSCDLIQMLGDVSSLAGKKRDPEVMKTPANSKLTSGKVQGSILRTVRRGEPVFSKNGSPVEQVEEGSLVATVAKRRRGDNKSPSTLAVEIAVGEGRYVNLAEPGTMKHVDKKMQNTILSQMQKLEDQFAAIKSQWAAEEE